MISRSVLLRTRNVSEKNVLEQIKTSILCSIIFSENRAIHVTMWKNIAGWAGHK
jgi:hypothetical protein